MVVVPTLVKLMILITVLVSRSLICVCLYSFRPILYVTDFLTTN